MKLTGRSETINAQPVTFAAIAGLLIAVALLACYFPACLGTKVNPLTVLRHD